MELSTFGSLLNFAIELEEKCRRFYEDAARTEAYSEARETFLALAAQNKRQKQLLERTRQDNVTEMILEPISGLKRTDYETSATLTEHTSYSEVLGLAMGTEEKAKRFYTESAGKAAFLLAEVKRKCDNLAQEKMNRRSELQLLYNRTTGRS